jgi:hypothetical protein
VALQALSPWKILNSGIGWKVLNPGIDRNIFSSGPGAQR